MKRLRAIVTGRVQGVGYRAAVQKRVLQLGGVTGYVKNMPDGTVEIVAEGAENALAEVLDIAMDGSFWCSVDSITTDYGPAGMDFTDFVIAY